jgi:hypothetical protein
MSSSLTIIYLAVKYFTVLETRLTFQCLIHVLGNVATKSLLGPSAHAQQVNAEQAEA